MTRETLVPLDVRQCSIGAPLPVVVATDYEMAFAYNVEVVDPEWDGSTIRLVELDSPEPAAIIWARGCRIHTFGAPNEEAIAGHRLAQAGLEAFAAFEVRNSSWITDLERANRVHSTTALDSSQA